MRSTKPKAKNLIVLHGLLGSSKNFRSLMKRPQVLDHANVYLVDLRNHGDSEQRPTMLPSEMANDIANFIQHHHIENPIILGHSLGGRVAMTTALHFPMYVAGLIVVDFAPIDYFSSPKYQEASTDLHQILTAMKDINLERRVTYQEVRQELHKTINSNTLTDFLLMNLLPSESESRTFKWRVEPQIILNNLEMITRRSSSGLIQATFVLLLVISHII
jgi:pimeloyl-ACP methyl ester carboxylesterase